MKLTKSVSGIKNPDSKARPLNMSPDCLDFLEIILQPAELKHSASNADFIRNNVLDEVRRKVQYAYNKRTY